MGWSGDLPSPTLKRRSRREFGSRVAWVARWVRCLNCIWGTRPAPPHGLNRYNQCDAVPIGLTAPDLWESLPHQWLSPVVLPPDPPGRFWKPPFPWFWIIAVTIWIGIQPNQSKTK